MEVRPREEPCSEILEWNTSREGLGLALPEETTFQSFGMEGVSTGAGTTPEWPSFLWSPFLCSTFHISEVVN